jgi:hypothetical protein
MQSNESVSESVVRRGREIYVRTLRARLEAEHRGQFAAIDPESGEYSIADDELGAVRLLRGRHPGVRPYLVRIGSRATYKLGGRFRVRAPR